PGPPPQRRTYRDIVAGILGLLLVAGAAALAVTLPKHDVLPPQFKVSFVEDTVDMRPSQTRNFTTANDTSARQDFLYEVPDDDITQFDINVYFTDDLPASDPDRFSVQLYDPDGNPQGGGITVMENAPPVRNATATNPPTQYDAQQKSLRLQIPLKAKPEDTVVEGDANATVDSIATGQEAMNRFTTHGTWKLHVALLKPGGCPTPSTTSASPDDVVRGAACLEENRARGKDSKDDLGNAFTVGSFSYRRFAVLAETLG
ncbi:MAG: hypothetical protein ABR562_01300, partial [Thermoplasmatota archaeon]